MTKRYIEEAIRKILGMKAKKTVRRVEEQSEYLLPGIPDELTLSHITSKLPWRAVYGLPLLNRRWRRAVQTRQIYEGRVSSHSTETLFVISYQAGPKRFIGLYSNRDQCRYFLPSIPEIAGGIPWSSQCISLDGKIYILGGFNISKRSSATSDLYMLDLVGQRQWKQCASMQKPRQDFGCGVISGKIYVFGGFTSNYEIIRESEQYDPKVDAWSLLMPTKHSRWCHKVAAVGEKLYVYGGFCYSDDSDYAQNQQSNWVRARLALSLEAYHPINDTWRLVEPFMERPLSLEGQLFVAKDKFYSMTTSNIHVCDVESKLWRHLHSFSFKQALPRGSDVSLTDALAVNDALLAIVDWAKIINLNDVPAGNYQLPALVDLFLGDNVVRRSYIPRSRGCGTENKRISWEMVYGSPSFRFLPVKHPVQL